jgi:ATP-dependent helicase HrpA
MKALRVRLDRLNGQLERDRAHCATLEGLQAPLAQAAASRPGLLLLCPAAQQYRWMVEEFRVSLFAQQLGTRIPVSVKRLQAQWREVETWLNSQPGQGLEV